MSGAEDPFSNVDEMAVIMHEQFTSFVKAGFTEDQALRLIAHMFAACSTGGDDE